MRLYADAGKRYRALTPEASHSYALFLLFSFLLHLLFLFLVQHWDFLRPAPTAPSDQTVQLVSPETLFPPAKKTKEVLFGTDRPEDLKSIPRDKETRLPSIPKSLAPSPFPKASQERTPAPLPRSIPPLPPAPSKPSLPPSPSPPPSLPLDSQPAEPDRPAPLPSLPSAQGKEAPSDVLPQAGGLPGLPFADAKTFDRMAKVFSDEEQRPKDAISLNTEDLKYFSYLLKVKNKIEYIWKYPASAADRGIQGDLLLNFTIHRDGRVSNVSVASSSGYDILDREAAEAVQTASPFPPLPETWKEDQITITGHFLYLNRYTYIR